MRNISVDAVEKRNIAWPRRESKPALYSAVCHYIDWAVFAIYDDNLIKETRLSLL
jgi:hypothetical protein